MDAAADGTPGYMSEEMPASYRGHKVCSVKNATTTINTWTYEVDGTDGNDAFIFNAGAYDVDTGEGNDTVQINNGSSITNLDLGNGTNQVFGTDAGYIGNFTGGEGTENVTLGTAGAGNVDLGDGNNQLFSDGWVENVTTGSGVDVSELDAGGGTVKLGGGDDIFRAEAFVNNVYGEDGNDTFETNSSGNFYGGADDDTFNFEYENNGANVTFDGGTGTDTLNIEVDSWDDVDFGQLSDDLSDYASTGEATLSDYGVTIEDVDVINIIVDGQTVETYDYGDLFA